MEDPSQQHGPGKQSEPMHSPEANHMQAGAEQSLREGLPTGTGLGKYRILERLHSTYNGVVYKARDMLLDRLVTIKQMNPALLDDPIACGLFKREAQFLARIPRGSRHIVNIHELIELERGLFIVGEYVNGQWLESLISKRHLDVMSALRMLRAAAMGLRTLHSLAMVHRGIHPQSIMVYKQMRAMITNLGTSAHEGDTTPVPVLFAQYTAPEILAGRVYDNRVDIYSLGMTLYEYCVGRSELRHVLDDTVADALTGARLWTDWQRDPRRTLPDASEINPSIPVALSSILRRMTAKDLDERYSSCQQVIDALDRHFEIRRGGATRLHVGIALGIQAQPLATMAGQLASSRQRPSSPLLTYQSNVNQPPPLAPATSTHAVRQTTTQQTQAQPNIIPPSVPTLPDARQGVQATGRQDLRRMRHVRALRPTPKVVRPEAIPAPIEVEEVHKSRTSHILTWTLASIFLITTTAAGGYALWYYRAGPGLTNPIVDLYADATAVYRNKDYETARAKFEEAASLDVSAPKFVRIRNNAEDWLLVVNARLALARDDFEETMDYVRQAEKRGVGGAEVGQIKRDCWAKKDAYRYQEETNRALERGHFAEAELKQKAFEERAAVAGLDTEALKARVQMSQEDKLYRDAMRRARKALIRGDFEAASLACVEAQRIRENTETAALARKIQNEKLKARYVLQGDDAMLDRSYATAAEAYEAANQLEPSEAIERKIREARARLLVERAQQKIDAGNLLAAQQDLSTSLWNLPTAQAKAKLKKYGAAFAAAASVQRADRKLAGGDFEDAISLYEKALPDIPPPANAVVEKKLRDARGGWAVIQGDRASAEGDWELALKKYQEAKALGRNGNLDAKIKTTQKKLGRTTTSPASPPATS